MLGKVQEMEYDSRWEYVGFLVVELISFDVDYLWRDEAWGSAPFVQVFVNIDKWSQSKIHYIQLMYHLLITQHQVLRLQIPMHHPLRVDILQALQYTDHNQLNSLIVKLIVFLDPSIETTSL